MSGHDCNHEHNYVRLTVADHEQDGFLALAEWRFPSEADAREAIASIDDRITDEMEPDIKADPFTFILDLGSPDYCWIDTGKRLLPTQEAMRLAPELVSDWLEHRPNPNKVDDPVPLLEAFPTPGAHS